MDSKKRTDMRIANILFLLHLAIVVFILSGWLFPPLSLEYIVVLAGTLLSWLFLGYCFLSKWEFTLRKKYDQRFAYHDEQLNDGYIAHYGRLFFNVSLPTRGIQRWGVVFLVLMLAGTVALKLTATDTAHAMSALFQ